MPANVLAGFTEEKFINPAPSGSRITGEYSPVGAWVVSRNRKKCREGFLRPFAPRDASAASTQNGLRSPAYPSEQEPASLIHSRRTPQGTYTQAPQPGYVFTFHDPHGLKLHSSPEQRWEEAIAASSRHASTEEDGLLQPPLTKSLERKEMMLEPSKVRYQNVEFRSTLEARWAAFFDELSWEWIYEPEFLKHYIPDFIIGKEFYVEVKPRVDRYKNRERIEKSEATRPVLITANMPQRFEFGMAEWAWLGNLIKGGKWFNCFLGNCKTCKYSITGHSIYCIKCNKEKIERIPPVYFEKLFKRTFLRAETGPFAQKNPQNASSGIRQFKATDYEIRRKLQELFQNKALFHDGEISFVNNVLYVYDGPLSPKQRKWAMKILGRLEE